MGYFDYLVCVCVRVCVCVCVWGGGGGGDKRPPGLTLAFDFRQS